ncbi:RsiV family protein [Seonamhaeicola sp.]|uniref:RsiV family protein n=1 Tax=Seonamhaeicola sp. TaxID=1912245 RepID=UPI0026227C35|nr:RsiV family protein [Seonamhaeicola sp.]
MKKKSSLLLPILGTLLVFMLMSSETKPNEDLTGQNTTSIYEENNKTMAVDKENTSRFIQTKLFQKEEGNYEIFYRYPFLDPKFNPSFKVFNDFIRNEYLDLDNSVRNILNETELPCHVGYDKLERMKRVVDYKIYTIDDHMLSILMYKANHYTDKKQNSYLFKTLNFDMEKGQFLSYDSVFKPGSEWSVLKQLNRLLEKKVNAEPKYEECSQLTPSTFEAYKNNFVIDKTSIKFYFDDCVICPVYSGNYFIEIPKSQVSEWLIIKA